MCRRADLLSEAADAADEILRTAFRLDVLKALNPQRRKDFLVIQRRIAQKLASATKEGEAAALRSALRLLDVDWPNLSAAGRDSVIRAARRSLRDTAQKTVPKVEDVLSIHAPDVASASRAGAVAQYNLGIEASLSLRDEKLAEWCATSQTHFVRDRLGRRADSLSERARRIVADGLDFGFGRDDIAERLASLAESGLGGGMGYWQVVSGAFLNRTRSAINVNAFEDAGIEKFRIEAILDEATSEVCRFMHGREFSVSNASAHVAAAQRLSDPEDVRTHMPWANKGKNDDGEDILYFGGADEPSVVAVVDSFGEGEKDRVGEYSSAMNTAALEKAGFSTPPFHGMCRSTIVALT